MMMVWVVWGGWHLGVHCWPDVGLVKAIDAFWTRRLLVLLGRELTSNNVCHFFFFVAFNEQPFGDEDVS